jgi:hypothetical protein
MKTFLVTSTVNSRYIGAGILLDRVDEYITLDARNSAQTSGNERAPSSSRDANDSGVGLTSHTRDDLPGRYTHILSDGGHSDRAAYTAYSRIGALFIPCIKVETYFFILLIFHRVLFESLISDALQVIHKGL